MKLNQFISGLSKFVSKSQVREELTGIYIAGNSATATDSFQVVELTLQDKTTDNFIVPADVFKGIKEHKATGIFADIKLEDKTAVITTLQGEKRLPVIQGSYPKTDGLWPDVSTEPQATCVVNGEFLANIASYLSKFTGLKGVKMSFFGAGKPLLIEVWATKSVDIPHAKALLMPIRQ